MRLKIPFQLIFGHWHDHICEKFCVLFTNFSFTVYKMKHPTFPSGLPSRDGPDGKGEKARVRAYVDRGYPGAQKMYEGVEMLAPIRKKPGKKLTDAEKASNKAHSRIRVYVEHAIRKVKTWRIMGDRYRNPLKKYDRINDVICGLVNQRLLWLAEQAA